MDFYKWKTLLAPVPVLLQQIKLCISCYLTCSAYLFVCFFAQSSCSPDVLSLSSES